MKSIVIFMALFLLYANSLHAIEIIFTNQSTATEFKARKDNRTKKTLSFKNFQLQCVLGEENRTPLNNTTINLPDSGENDSLNFEYPQVIEIEHPIKLKITLWYDEEGAQAFTLLKHEVICEVTPLSTHDKVTIDFQGLVLSTTLNDITIKHHHTTAHEANSQPQ